MNVHKVRRKIATVLALAVATAGLSAAPALAEDSWTSTFSGWLPGQDTRRWYDSNSDSTSTQLDIVNCTQDNYNSFSSLNWEMRRDRSFLPDVSYGTKISYCKNHGETFWGDVTSGDYFFEYKSANGGPDRYYSADSITVSF